MTEGDIIKAVRMELGLSQQKFAKEIHVAFSTVNRWENGKSTPNSMARALLSDYMRKNKISKDWIKAIEAGRSANAELLAYATKEVN